jgi:dihydropyrimidinase
MSGSGVFAETCPQYLYLDDSLYAKSGWEAAKYVCSPPLRGRGNLDGLWRYMSEGFVDVIATDHCSFNFKGQKERGRGDFRNIPNGMPGVENRMLLLYKGVAEGRITLPQMVRLASANPAAIFGLYPKKGTMVPGADADIVVLDPAGRTVISAARQRQNVDYTPFEGFEIPASIDRVFLRGLELCRDGKFVKDSPEGRYVSRGASGTRI